MSVPTIPSGVVLLKDALDPRSLAAAEAAYDWSLANPGPGASRLPQKGEGVFLNDLFNPRCLEGYREMLEASPLPTLIADIWGAADVWFFYEQVFLKEGGETRRTRFDPESAMRTLPEASTATSVGKSSVAVTAGMKSSLESGWPVPAIV